VEEEKNIRKSYVELQVFSKYFSEAFKGKLLYVKNVLICLFLTMFVQSIAGEKLKSHHNNLSLFRKKKKKKPSNVVFGCMMKNSLWKAAGRLESSEKNC
jgi:ABC-type uncharacterized transport system permease subunit